MRPQNRITIRDMPASSNKALLAALAGLLLLLAAPAHAFRCKNKLVTDGMYEEEVLAVCGEPVSRRHLGYVVRSYLYDWRGMYQVDGRSHRRGRTLTEEVLVTEFVYNFGPRKLMRRLVFEGGILTVIETMGYGYIDKGDGNGASR